MESTLTFQTSDGKTLTRHGQVTTDYLTKQAQAEFGDITVVSKTEGSDPQDIVDKTPQVLATLNAARHNITVVQSQLQSLTQDNPMTQALADLDDLLKQIDTEITNLGG